MGRVSVHLEEMASLVRELRTVAESLAGDAETIDSAVRWNGGAKRIGGESFTSTCFDNLSEVGAWADDQVPTLSRQLDYARWLQSSTPGMQGEVSFDADDVPHLDDEEIQDRAREANNLLSTMPPISDRLVLLLQTYGFDERFAGVLDAPVDALEMVQLARKEVDEEDLESFDEDYAVLLESLGLIASLESGRYDPELDAGWLGGPPDFSRYNTRDLKLEAMLMSYGTWDEGYLDAFAQNLIERQREDPEIWTETMFGHSGHYDSIYSPILPGGGVRGPLRRPDGGPVEQPRRLRAGGDGGRRGCRHHGRRRARADPRAPALPDAGAGLARGRRDLAAAGAARGDALR